MRLIIIRIRVKNMIQAKLWNFYEGYSKVIRRYRKVSYVVIGMIRKKRGARLGILNDQILKILRGGVDLKNKCSWPDKKLRGGYNNYVMHSTSYFNVSLLGL